MPRVDAWDVKTQPDADVSIGLSRGFADRFTFGQELGRGGFGVVRAVTDAHTGEQLACKTIVKRLAVPNLSAAKQQQHLEKIKRELEVGCEWRIAHLWHSHMYTGNGRLHICSKPAVQRSADAVRR